MPGDVGVVAGGHNKTGPGGHSPVSLIDGQDRTRAQQHIWDFLGDGADSVLGGGGAEGDLSGGKTAGNQSLGQGDRFAGILNGDDRDNTDLTDSF